MGGYQDEILYVKSEEAKKVVKKLRFRNFPSIALFFDGSKKKLGRPIWMVKLIVPQKKECYRRYVGRRCILMNIALIAGHLAFGLIAFSFLVKDILWLRVVSILASLFSVFYNYLHTSRTHVVGYQLEHRLCSCKSLSSPLSYMKNDQSKWHQRIRSCMKPYSKT